MGLPPQPAFLLLLATVLPLISFCVLVFLGKRMGKPLAGWVATAAIGASFVCSCLAWIKWGMGGDYEVAGQTFRYQMGKLPINIPINWVPSGITGGKFNFLTVGLYIDSVTLVMFSMITLVATLVHVFSLAYMADDKRYPRFFTYLGLFCFSMLGLVIGGTILQLFIFWELVGLCSYLLIGFWYEKKSASNAAIKAFVTNRVGDFGFLIGLGILFYHLGNVTLPEVWAALDASKLAAGGQIALPTGATITASLMTVMGIGLFFGAVGKSAQFPLHVWLPDAMEGPTPVSALIHAATMVAAGVYLVARIYPILTPDARLFIAIIGCVTLVMAALIAIAQSDIKKVLAYSTLSQLGYMILAMGVGSWVGGLFHLLTHAFFKALLFLGSGSVIHAAHHEQEMPQYGGLWRKIPWTAGTFLVAVLAIAGTPFLSAFYSKDMILLHAGAFAHDAEHSSHSPWYKLLFWLPVITAVITAFYMTRCWMLTFWGKPRNRHLYDHAHETPILYWPLVVLAVLSVIAGYGGYYGIHGRLLDAMAEGTAVVKQIAPGLGDGYNLYSQAWQSTSAEPTGAVKATLDHAHHQVMPFAWSAWIVGIGLGVVLYWNGYAIANRLMKIPPLRALHWWLYRRMLFDELYWGVFVAITIGLSRLAAAFDREVVDRIVNWAAEGVRRLSVLAGLHDTYVVDGAVNGMANATQSLGAAVRAPQSGRIRLYVTVLLGMVALGVVAVMVVVLSR